MLCNLSLWLPRAQPASVQHLRLLEEVQKAPSLGQQGQGVEEGVEWVAPLPARREEGEEEEEEEGEAGAEEEEEEELLKRNYQY